MIVWNAYFFDIIGSTWIKGVVTFRSPVGLIGNWDMDNSQYRSVFIYQSNIDGKLTIPVNELFGTI